MRSFGYSIISNHEKSWKLISGFWSSCNFELGAAEKFVDLVDVEKSLMLKIECVSARLGFDTAESGQRKIWRIPPPKISSLGRGLRSWPCLGGTVAAAWSCRSPGAGDGSASGWRRPWAARRWWGQRRSTTRSSNTLSLFQHRFQIECFNFSPMFSCVSIYPINVCYMVSVLWNEETLSPKSYRKRRDKWILVNCKFAKNSITYDHVPRDVAKVWS